MFLNDFNAASIVRVFNTELDKLCAEFKYSDMTSEHIGVVYIDYSSDVLSLVKRSVYKRCNNTDVKIAVCESLHSFSAEWPAVVVLCQVAYFEEAGYLSEPLLSVIKSTCTLHCYYIPSEGSNIRQYSSRGTFIRETE